MLIPVIFGLVFLWFGWQPTYDMFIVNHYSPATLIDYMLWIIMLACFSAFPVVLGYGVAYLIGRYVPLPRKALLRETYALVSLRNGSGTLGNFFLGSGSVGSSEYYFYYYKLLDGAYSPGRVIANSSVSIIEQDDRKDGELKVFCIDFSPRFLRLFAFFPDVYYRYTYVFVIPKDSLKQNFRLE